VAQEALRNAIGHARAQQVTLRMRLSLEQALVIVQDDGRGFCVPADLNAFALADHVGLIGIAERVAGVGGALVIETGSVIWFSRFALDHVWHHHE
jgi:two-component system NarL family sensor kinase